MFLLENLKKSYNGRHGRLVLDIDRLSLTGQGIVLLSGPNGSGKTTLLNILAFLDLAYKGKLWFKNNTVRPSMDYTPLRRKVALLMEAPYFFKGTVFDNISYGLRVRGLAEGEIFDRVERILAKVGLTDFKDQEVDTLSGGEKQRLALARVLVLDTEIMLLDEPMLRMDKDYVKVFKSIITDYSQDKMVIMTGHNLSQFYQLANKVISLVDGKIVKNDKLS